MARNTWRAPRGARGRRGAGRSHPATALVLLALLAGLAGVGMSSLFGTLAAEGASAADATAILAVALSAAWIGMLIFDVHHVVSTLLLDADIDLLRRAPLPNAGLFALKLVDSLPRTSAWVLALAAPALLAFVNRFPVPAWDAWLIPLQLAALWGSAMGIGTLLAVAVVKTVPARVAREALGLLSTIALVVLWMANAFLVPQLVENGEALLASLRAEAQAPAVLQLLSPGHAIARASVAAATDRAPAAFGDTAWLVFVATVAMVISAAVVERALPALRGAVTAPPQAARRERPRPSGTARIGGVTVAVIGRDARLYRRDWTVLGDVVAAAVLWTLLPVLSASLITATPVLMVRAMLVTLTVGLGYEVAARAVPFERDGIAWARLAPVAPGRWVRAKTAASAALALPLFALTVIALAWTIHLGVRDWLATLSVALSAFALALPIGLWTGIRFGDPGWTNPRAMLTVTGRIVATCMLLAQAIGWLGLSAAFWVGAGRWPAGADLWLPPVIALAAAWVVTMASTRRFARFEK